ncbi:MAG: HAD family hydrolase [Acidimicrobiia bacterium]
MPRPEAVLLDVGGVLLLPDHDRLLAALGRAGFSPPVELLDRAHYAGAARLDTGTVDGEWPHYWHHYIDAFLTACAVPDELREAAHEHLGSEHATQGLWTRVAPGSPDGLRALVATGVRLGIVSNSDGTVEQQLRAFEIAQTGPGAGIEVEVVVDSSVAGVAKPDPRIFAIALAAMGIAPEGAWYVGDTPAFDVDGAHNAGLHPLLLDPFRLHLDDGRDRVDSLAEVAARIQV